MWKILKEIGIPDHLTGLLRKPYVGQEATVKTRHGAKGWSEFGMSTLNLSFHSASWRERHVKCWSGWITSQNQDYQEKYQQCQIFRGYHPEMAESEEELKSLLMRMKEESEKAHLKLNIQKIKTMASGPITSWQIEAEKVETLADLISFSSRIAVHSNSSQNIWRILSFGRKAMTT